MKSEDVYGETKSSLPIFHFILNAFSAGIFSKFLASPEFILCEEELSSARKRRRMRVAIVTRVLCHNVLIIRAKVILNK